MSIKKVIIVGTGYAELSLATLIARKIDVTALDINQKKVGIINSRKSTISDECITKLFEREELKLFATRDKNIAFKECDLVVIATPTNYDEKLNNFDT